MRIRTVKPDFFTHERLFDAEREANLPLRLAFIGLWCAADREGRFRWEPRRLGVQILPYDGVDFARVLDALATRGFVVKYTSPEGVFGCIPSFLKHQVINNREAESQLPPPPTKTTETLALSRDGDACPTREEREGHASKAEGKGREGNNGEREEVAQPQPEPPLARGNAWPTLDDVLRTCGMLNIPPDTGRAFWEHFEAQGWQTGQGVAIVQWTAKLSAWWRKEQAQQAEAKAKAAAKPKFRIGTETAPDEAF